MKKKQAYLSKQTLNLVIKERSSHYALRMTAATLMGALLIAIFCKFAVIDQLAVASDAWNETRRVEADYQELVNSTRHFDSIQAEYNKYFASEAAKEKQVDCLEVLRIINKKLLPITDIQSVSLKDNVLSVVLTGIDLDYATSILEMLYDTEELVRMIDLSKASNSDEQLSSIAMNITLNPQGGTAK